MEYKRAYYVDWLRVLAVLLLFVFHGGRPFSVGETFYARSAALSLPIGALLGFIDAWHMPLLFLLAGASTYFAMRRRTVGGYVRERSLRLLVPLLFGILVLVPPQTWLGARTNDAYTGSFVEYVTSGRLFSLQNLFGRGDYFGGLSPAHLWFIMFLWLISMVALPLVAAARTGRGTAWVTGLARTLAKPWTWLAVVFVILIAEAMPDIGGKNIIFYLVFFLLGFVVMHDDGFMRTAERLRAPALAVGVVLCAAGVLLPWGDALPDPSLPRALWTYGELLGGWLVVVGLLGMGRAYLDKPSPALRYLTEASYPVYILHQTVIVIVAFYLVAAVSSPALAWPALIAISAAITFALYEGVRRTRVSRFLFGMRAKAPVASTQ